MTSHVFCVGSPKSGKTYYLLNTFTQAIFITFVKYTQLEDHCKAIIDSNKTLDILIIDDLVKVRFPKRDILILDCSRFKGEIEFQLWLIDMMELNKSHYTTLIIDECQTLLPTSKRQNPETNPYLDHVTKSRNFGYRLIMASQRPQAISSQALEMCQGYICLKLTGRLAIKTMDEILKLQSIDDYITRNANLKNRQIIEYVLSE